ncbi:MAG: hypothetical protein HEQ32_00150 [Vampirovibrio sp.]
MPFQDTSRSDNARSSAEGKRARFQTTGLKDEYGIPISTPANYEPLPLGVQDELLGVFPASVIESPWNLLPCPVSVALSKKVIQPQDASFINQLVGNAFQFLSPQAKASSRPLNPPKLLSSIEDLSKAYYKGQIPEILFAHTILPEVEAALIEDLAVYAEKLIAIGFISTDTKRSSSVSPLNEDTAVHRALPCVVIVGHGFLYQRFLKHFLERLESLGHSKTERKQLQRLLSGRVCRGQVIPSTPSVASSRPLSIDTVQSIDPAENPKPTFRLAGGLNKTQRQVQQALGRHGVNVTIEHNSSNPTERLELQALNTVFQTILLTQAYQAWEATQKKRASLKPIAHYRQQIMKILFSLGVHRQAFHGYEAPVAIGMPCDKSEITPASEALHTFICDELRDFLPALLDYCNSLGLLKEDHSFAELITHIQPSPHRV